MAKKSLNRQLRDREEKKLRGALHRLDMLAAAYCVETGIQPTQARLVVEEIPLAEQKPNSRSVRYYYEHFDRTINDQLAHPDVKILLSYALMLRQEHEKNNTQGVGDILNQLCEFLRKYDADESTAKTAKIEGKTSVQDSERAES